MCVPRITLKVGKYCKSKSASGARKLFKEETDEIKEGIVMTARTLNARVHLLSFKVYWCLTLGLQVGLPIYVSAHSASVGLAESNTCYHTAASILYPGFMPYSIWQREVSRRNWQITKMTVTFCRWTFCMQSHADCPIYPNGLPASCVSLQLEFSTS